MEISEFPKYQVVGEEIHVGLPMDKLYDVHGEAEGQVMTPTVPRAPSATAGTEGTDALAAAVNPIITSARLNTTTLYVKGAGTKPWRVLFGGAVEDGGGLGSAGCEFTYKMESVRTKRKKGSFLTA
ncbi:unnamed protein product [Cylicocyclus nassatus]|uniref:Uncharacterized protein n=1 Tax=Cylicocyclus nassatus TaxID=53992 RepID=A0AA36M5P9_CYLNA|nr:unnamed protein product [Cylicocyclus nassatus]